MGKFKKPHKLKETLSQCQKGVKLGKRKPPQIRSSQPTGANNKECIIPDMLQMSIMRTLYYHNSREESIFGQNKTPENLPIALRGYHKEAGDTQRAVK